MVFFQEVLENLIETFKNDFSIKDNIDQMFKIADKHYKLENCWTEFILGLDFEIFAHDNYHLIETQINGINDIIITYNYNSKELLYELMDVYNKLIPLINDSNINIFNERFGTIFKMIIKEMYTKPEIEKQIIQELYHPNRIMKWWNENPKKNVEEYMSW